MAIQASSDFMKGSTGPSALGLIKTDGKVIAVCSSHVPTLANSTYANVLHTGSSTGLCFCKTTKMASTDWTIQASTPAGAAVVMGLSSNTSGMQVVNNPSKGGAAVGIGKHVVIAGATRLLYVLTCTTISLTTSDQVTVPSFRICIQDPTSS